MKNKDIDTVSLGGKYLLIFGIVSSCLTIVLCLRLLFSNDFRERRLESFKQIEWVITDDEIATSDPSTNFPTNF